MASSSSWVKVMAALAIVAMFLALTVDARPTPDADGDHPDWPCCRQYDTPPTVTTEETVVVEKSEPASARPLPIPGFNVPPVASVELDGEENTVEPEWPCCRQYDAPPVVGGTEN